MWFSIFPKTTKVKFEEFFGGLLHFLESAFVRLVLLLVVIMVMVVVWMWVW